ncbi:hypothetical protein [Streptomyces stelliscabiei]|uniref:hypothetical protein n=1 Tax=Streptomyces stelliscabiei TaxID=146820 RepID=UPI002FF136CD
MRDVGKESRRCELERGIGRLMDWDLGDIRGWVIKRWRREGGVGDEEGKVGWRIDVRVIRRKGKRVIVIRVWGGGE